MWPSAIGIGHVERRPRPLRERPPEASRSRVPARRRGGREPARARATSRPATAPCRCASRSGVTTGPRAVTMTSRASGSPPRTAIRSPIRVSGSGPCGPRAVSSSSEISSQNRSAESVQAGGDAPGDVAVVAARERRAIRRTTRRRLPSPASAGEPGTTAEGRPAARCGSFARIGPPVLVRDDATAQAFERAGAADGGHAARRGPRRADRATARRGCRAASSPAASRRTADAAPAVHRGRRTRGGPAGHLHVPVAGERQRLEAAEREDVGDIPRGRASRAAGRARGAAVRRLRAALMPATYASTMATMSGSSADTWRSATRRKPSVRVSRSIGSAGAPRISASVPRPARRRSSSWKARSWPWQKPSPNHASASFAAVTWGIPQRSRATLIGAVEPGQRGSRHAFSGTGGRAGGARIAGLADRASAA